MKKFWKFSNVVVMTFSTLHGPKLNPIIYSCSPKCGAFSHTGMIIFRCSNNSHFDVILKPVIKMGVFTFSPQKLKMATFHCLVSYYILKRRLCSIKPYNGNFSRTWNGQNISINFFFMKYFQLLSMQNSSGLVFRSFIYGLIAPEKLITNTYFLFSNCLLFWWKNL